VRSPIIDPATGCHCRLGHQPRRGAGRCRRVFGIEPQWRGGSVVRSGDPAGPPYRGFGMSASPPAAHAALDNPRDVAFLLDSLREAGTHHLLAQHQRLGILRRRGPAAEPDESASP